MDHPPHDDSDLNSGLLSPFHSGKGQTTSSTSRLLCKTTVSGVLEMALSTTTIDIVSSCQDETDAGQAPNSTLRPALYNPFRMDAFDSQTPQDSDDSFDDGILQEIVPFSSQGWCQRQHGVWAAAILQTADNSAQAGGDVVAAPPSPSVSIEKDQSNTTKRSLMGVWLTSHNASNEKEDNVQRWMASVIPVDETSN